MKDWEVAARGLGIATLDKLRRDGIAELPWAMCPGQIDDFIQYLNPTTVFNAHVRAKAHNSSTLHATAGQNRWNMYCHTMEDVVRAPWFFGTAVGLLRFADQYFEEPARMYSVNGFWTEPAPGTEYGDTHSWHRDNDDRKQLVLFMYGQDVFDADAGAHLYQKGTHNLSDEQLGRSVHAPPDGTVEMVTGPAGTMFLADTRGLHMGLRPKEHPRMLAWARFGVSNPPISYRQDQLSPVAAAMVDCYPSDPDIRERIALVVS